MADLAILQGILGVSLRELPLLEQALVHSSYVNENPALVAASNERLEFLGDAVLGLVIAEKLYQDFPQLDEGKMTALRASLVRQETLARIARDISLGDYLYLGKGEMASGGRHKPSNLARALEAVLAAIFLTQGLAAVREVVLRLFQTELEKITQQGIEIDYKSQLQEFLQSRKQPPPQYEMVQETGPDHSKAFIVEVKVGGMVLGGGSGRSKKIAEREAARAALEKLAMDFTP